MSMNIELQATRPVHRDSWQVVAVLIGILALIIAFGSRDKGISQNEVITVSGEGKSYAVADTAMVSFGVQNTDTTAGRAQEKTTTAMNALLEKVRSLGIEEKDIKTVAYAVYPNYSAEQPSCMRVPCPQGPVITGYTASHTVEVKIRKADMVSSVLTALGDAGADTISGVQFVVDDEEEVLRKARAEAIEDAKQKAKILAKDLDVRLGDLVGFSESGGGGLYYTKAMAPSREAMDIPRGENEVRSMVTLTYRIK